MFIPYLLAVYIVLFVFFIVSLAIRVKRRTGVFPIIHHRSGAYGFVDTVVFASYLLVIANAVVYIAGSVSSALFVPVSWLYYSALQTAGVIMVGVSLLFMYTAQLQMGDSWRIGIDEKHSVDLVNRGLFRYFRHPIYFFALLIGLGMVLVIPTAVSIGIFMLLYFALSVQARLEEEYMLRTFGEPYRLFMTTHRRFF